jgi:anti-sigma factor RsiW
VAKHPETDLVPYLRGELPPAERERVARHLDECPDCRQDADQLRELLGELSRSVAEPPPVNWARYRAELRVKLEARRGRRSWWWQPVPLAMATSLAGALLFVAVWGVGRQVPTPGSPVTFEEAAIGSNLGLLEQYQVVERLDLLEEDLDLMTDLDGLAAGRQG